jgi:acetoin utilization deacetylase AcuC-like enzyme
VHVVFSEGHRAHEPATEVDFGQVLPMFERPERVEEIRRALEGRPDEFRFVAPTDHGTAPIEAVHDPGLVAFLADAWAAAQREEPRAEVLPDTFIHAAIRDGMGPAPQPAGVSARLGYWCFETMTPLVEGTYAAARGAVDVALTAADLVLGGERAAYGLCRPPGHHAPRAAYGGYCYFNNAGVVAHDVATRTGTKVTVLDVDYHHGNGTQQIFYGRDDVQYVSLHGDPNRAYPYFAGYADETGVGRGMGTTLNLPLAARTADDAYLSSLEHALEAIERFDPSVLVVSLGVDTYHLDPIADLALTTEGFGHCGALVAGLSRPTVVLQEGGYHLGAIGENVRTWLQGFAAVDGR